MDEAGNYGFGTRWPESFYGDFASILEACEIEGEEETSGGAATFPTLILETSVVGHESPREPGETDGGGGKASDPLILRNKNGHG